VNETSSPRKMSPTESCRMSSEGRWLIGRCRTPGQPEAGYRDDAPHGIPPGATILPPATRGITSVRRLPDERSRHACQVFGVTTDRRRAGHRPGRSRHGTRGMSIHRLCPFTNTFVRPGLSFLVSPFPKLVSPIVTSSSNRTSTSAIHRALGRRDLVRDDLDRLRPAPVRAGLRTRDEVLTDRDVERVALQDLLAEGVVDRHLAPVSLMTRILPFSITIASIAASIGWRRQRLPSRRRHRAVAGTSASTLRAAASTTGASMFAASIAASSSASIAASGSTSSRA